MLCRPIVGLVACLLALGPWAAPACAHDDQAGHKPTHAEAEPGGAAVHSTAAAPHPHEHDPFEELSDSYHWLIFKNDWFEIGFNLPKFEGAVLKGISKFMVLELIASGLILAIYIPLARRMQSGALPKGCWDNAFESLLTFIRNDVAKPNLGDHEADRYMPFLWTLFLFILFNNLLGMFPFMGSPTANLYVTGGLAVIAFAIMHGAAIAKMGFVHYLQSLWPHMDVPF